MIKARKKATRQKKNFSWAVKKLPGAIIIVAAVASIVYYFDYFKKEVLYKGYIKIEECKAIEDTNELARKRIQDLENEQTSIKTKIKETVTGRS